MNRYEILFLTIPHLTSDEGQLLETEFDKLVKKFKGSVLSFERWGKFKLAYPVRKNDYGIYFLARFEIDDEHKQEFLDSLQTLMKVKLIHLVMRYMVTHLSMDEPLEYARPESLEDMPSRDVDKFLKDNKMQGLMPNTREKKSSTKEESSPEVSVTEQQETSETVAQEG